MQPYYTLSAAVKSHAQALYFSGLGSAGESSAGQSRSTGIVEQS